MEIAVSLDETAVESHTTIEGREVRDVIRKPYIHCSPTKNRRQTMQYGTVYLRYPDVYAALQCVQDVVGSGGSCCYSNYSYFRLQEPKKVDNGFRIDIPSNGGYYIAIELTEMEPGVYQTIVLGSNYGLASTQDRFGRDLVANLKKKSSGGGGFSVSVHHF